MNKKIRNTIFVIISIILAVSLLAYFNVINLPFAVFDSGCVQILNNNTPGASYTEVQSVSSYTCDTEFCIVWGSMNLIKSTVIQAVPCAWESSGSCCCYSGNSKTCGNRQRDCSTQMSTYKANFNFCPDSNFPYCSGDKNLVNQVSPGLVTTDEWKVSKGKTITFNPKYSDGTDVTEKYIYIRKADCTCKNAVNEGNACDQSITNKGLCSKCPSGYTWQFTYYCGNTWVGTQKCSKSGGQSGISDNCAEPYTSYQKCDGTKTIGTYGTTCGNWNTNTLCPTGQYCYSDSNNKQESAFGGCKCPTDPCKLGEKETNPLDSAQFRECEKVGNCLKWGDYKYCPTGLAFSGLTKTCVCNPTTSCNPGETQCASTSTIKRCVSVSYSGVSCWVWGNPEGCSGDLTCNDLGNTLKDDICDCTSSNKCKIGDIQCIDANSYKECSSGSSTCLDYRTVKTVDSTQMCSNNQLVTKAGCNYGNPACGNGYICSNNACVPSGCGYPNNLGYSAPDVNNFEVCVNNQYVCLQDENSYTGTDLTVKQCYKNTVQYVKTYTGSHISCNRWENKTDAPNSNKGVCLSDFTCLNGACTSNNKFIAITSLDIYPIGQVFTDLKVVVQDTVPNKAQSTVIAQLLDTSGTEPLSNPNYHSINGLGVSGDGTLNLDFGYSPSNVGEYTVKVIVRDVNGQTYYYSKKINVAKTLKVLLNCPTGIVGRSLSCTLDVIDASCSISSYCSVASSKLIKITQGGEEITDYQQNPSSTGGINLVFTPKNSGIIDVSVTASAQNYISATTTSKAIINLPSLSHTILLDNRDYSISGSTTIGNHQISVTPLESGLPVDTSSILVYVTNPSSGIDTYTLSDSLGTGTFTGSISLTSAGQLYPIKVQVVPTDPLKRADPQNNIIFSVNTLGSGTTDWWSNYAIIISVIAGVVIILIILIIVIVKRKK